MNSETIALPTDEKVAAGGPSTDVLPVEKETSAEGTEAKKEGEDKENEPVKKEKTTEQREIERLRRRVDNLTRRKYELEAAAPRQEQRTQQTQARDDEPVTLSRAELNKVIEEQAQRLAPSLTEKSAEAERKSGIVKTLAKQWGQEEFDAKASELDDVFGGLADRSGKPKPATDAIFDADDPKAVIEYLTDPDNADEAERIAQLSGSQAGRAIAKLEARLEADKAKAKPKASNAAAPIESVKGGGVANGMPNPSNTKAYIRWANEQERLSR